MIERSQERLAVSFLIAVAFHLIFALFLSFIDWDKGGDSSRLKPVVIFASVPEDVPAPPPPEPEPEPRPAPAASEPAPAPAPRAASPAPAPAAASTPAARTRPQQEAAVLPSRVPRITQPAAPQLPPEDKTVRNQYSEGSEIVYADDPSGEDTELSRAPEEAEAPVEEDKSLMPDSAVDQQLSAISSRDGTGKPASGETGEQTGASGSVSSNRPVSSQPQVFLEDGANRELLEWFKPDITPDMLKEFPRDFSVVVEFSLNSEGRVLFPNVLPPSGSTNLDNVIENAVRNWQFSELENASGKTVSGKVQLNIQVQ